MPVVPTTPVELRARLLALFPAFAQVLPDLLFADDDGVFTAHGLWSEFSHFYREQVLDFTSPEVIALFDLIEAFVASDPHDRDPLVNAVAPAFWKTSPRSRSATRAAA